MTATYIGHDGDTWPALEFEREHLAEAEAAGKPWRHYRPRTAADEMRANRYRLEREARLQLEANRRQYGAGGLFDHLEATA